jgi:hypothetical protein
MPGAHVQVNLTPLGARSLLGLPLNEISRRENGAIY